MTGPASRSLLLCPVCGHTESQVRDSRGVPDHRYIRRTRRCEACRQNFSTREAVDAEFARLEAIEAEHLSFIATLRSVLL